MSGGALVLGGGGITGIAWEIGMLFGLAEAGVDLTGADLVVGTSAGSVVGAQILGGASLAELYERQRAPRADEELSARPTAGFVLMWVVAGLRPNGRAWLGRQALRARTGVTPEQRRQVIADRIGTDAWPATKLLVTAVEAETGAFHVFDRDSGVSLIDAVAASCAVPLIWPPHPVGGVRYVDGGVRSVANLDLAGDAARLVALTPVTGGFGRPKVQARRLHIPYALVAPNDFALSKMGRNPLDPAFRASAAEAGRQQAGREAEKVGEVWKQK